MVGDHMRIPRAVFLLFVVTFLVMLCCYASNAPCPFFDFFLSVSHTTKNESPFIFSTTLLHSLSVCRQILLLCCVALSLHFFLIFSHTTKHDTLHLYVVVSFN